MAATNANMSFGLTLFVVLFSHFRSSHISQSQLNKGIKEKGPTMQGVGENPIGLTIFTYSFPCSPQGLLDTTGVSLHCSCPASPCTAMLDYTSWYGAERRSGWHWLEIVDQSTSSSFQGCIVRTCMNLRKWRDNFAKGIL